MITILKEDFRLFSKLFISCQSRECDRQEFFRYEKQSFPAASSVNGKLHTGQKSHLAAMRWFSYDKHSDTTEWNDVWEIYAALKQDQVEDNGQDEHWQARQIMANWQSFLRHNDNKFSATEKAARNAETRLKASDTDVLVVYFSVMSSLQKI